MYSIVEILLFGGIMLIMAFIITLPNIPGTLGIGGPFCMVLLMLFIISLHEYVADLSYNETLHYIDSCRVKC